MKFKLKISKTWLVVIIIILLAAGYYITKSFLKKPSDGYITEKAIKGEVLKEISETGSIKATESVSMGFKSMGKIAKINIAKGSNVKKGDILAQLDLSQASAQLQSAQAALEASQREYDKLLSGLTTEDIKIYQDAVTSAKNDLQSAYDSSLNILNDAYTKVYNSYTTVAAIRSSYFSASDQEGIKFNDREIDLNENFNNIKKYLDIAKKSTAGADIDNAIAEIILSLNSVYNDLKVIREQCDSGIYYTKIPSTDKTSLDTQKGYINTALTNVATSQQDINSYKIDLQKAEDNLIFKTAAPRREDVDIYRFEVDKARANVNLYQSQLGDFYLKSPIDGKITGVDAKTGEVVSASETIINLLSLEPFQIKVNIYEQDIVDVKINDLVLINLVAFPKQTFEGKVIALDPGEKIIDNVVYYEVTIDFPNQPEGVKSGMTADIVIKTNKKDNVLRVPKNAIENIDGKDILQVITNKKVEDRQITAGLEGNDYVEVLSGLAEGEEIIIGKK